ncbi:LPS export ABC transporter periplasmic protein LptC [Hydrogenophaga sp.]|uniref:LPS export ABC transporter periplasmic protein LptC n=1 Tax=Hydrogenophaga sp. TaxID=1904254 RepID=UPI002725FA23|nr:LPS export ABC transporter periplasmic protein LptC [Hydrogenophaga sp.]MDO8903108.1 LPS export ABC transporter periplasmic protein LptC [Hydrogenophaga sp.]
MNSTLPLEPLNNAAPRVVKKRAYQVWDQVSIYLPVLLMGLLAMASYWLLRATPMPEALPEERELTHEPDYYMQRFSVKVFDVNGRIRSEVYGAEGRHYPDTDTLEIDKARIRNYSPEGQLTTATAQRVTSNGDSTEFILEGDAIVVRQAGKNAAGKRLPRLEFHGEYLRVLTKWDALISDQPVLLIRDTDQMRADSLLYRGDRQAALLKGRVQVQMQPR